MVRNFKFFHGIVGGIVTNLFDTEINRMSEEIQRQIDEDIVDTMVRLAEDNNFDIVTRNVDIDYLRRYLEIGGNRA
jgi:hypothetical protein